jgi:hypothetical protein
MDISNMSDIQINQLEYCIIAEKTYLPAETVKVYIPKLNIDTSKCTVRANESILVNDPDCKPKVVNPIKLLDTITVKTFSGLELSKSAVITKEECGCYVSNHQLVKVCHGDRKTFIDGHISSAYLPKGAQMIVCFMDGNINDAYLTNFI